MLLLLNALQTPQSESSARFIYQKTTPETAMLAAALASASRVLKTIDPQRSATYLGAAEHAWAFLQANPGTIPAAGFQNPAGCGTG